MKLWNWKGDFELHPTFQKIMSIPINLMVLSARINILITKGFLASGWAKQEEKGLMKFRFKQCKLTDCRSVLSVHANSPEAFQRVVKLHKCRRNCRPIQANIMGRRHGYQALDSSQWYSAAFRWAHETAANAILAIVLGWSGKDAVRTKALHGQGHAICKVRTENSVSRWTNLYLLAKAEVSCLWQINVANKPPETTLSVKNKDNPVQSGGGF